MYFFKIRYNKKELYNFYLLYESNYIAFPFIKKLIMKKMLLTCSMLVFVLLTFAQTEKSNGTIYINHPNIDVVNKMMKAYETQNMDLYKSCYSDTVKFFVPGSDKFDNLKKNVSVQNVDFKYFNNISMKPVGYPDYLHYKKDDSKTVQSWWTWSGTSKKTGKVTFVIFDDFNTSGKIISETSYGDFTKQLAEEGK